MSKRHPIDELFSQQLANSSAPVPDDMWDRIANSRQKPNRRPILLAWGTAGVLLAGLSILALWTGSSPELGFFPAEADGNSQQNTVATHTEDATDRNAILLAEATVDLEMNINSPSTHTATAATSLKPVAAKAKSKTPLRGQNTASASDFNERKASTELLSVETEATTDATENLQNTTDAAALTEESSRVAGPHQRVRMGRVNTLSSKVFTLTRQNEIKLFANHAPRCADFNSPFFHLDAELIGGPAYAQQSLIAKTNESGAHLKQRQESESASLSSSIGLRLAATTHTGLGLRSGLSYTQINETFTYHVGSRMDVSTIFGANGEVIGQDTTYLEAYNESRTNRLKFLEIPLLLGFEKKVGKLRIGVNAGAYLNLYFDAKGTVFSPATAEPIAFGQEGDLNRLPIFERRATAAWYGGISLAYNLHSRYSLLAEPYFKSYPRALSSSGYDLAQNYWMTGLQVGLRMRL